MAQNGNTGKGKSSKRILEWITGGLFVLLFVITIVVSIFLDSIVKNRIIKEVREASDGLYILNIEDLDAKFWSGAIRMKNVWLRPDGLVLQRMRKKDTSAYIPNVNFHLESVNISSIKWKKYLLNPKNLEIGKVLIQKPDFIVEAHIVPGKDIKQNNKNFLDYLPGIIAAFIGSLKIESIQVKEGYINFDLHSKGEIIHQISDSIHLDLTHIVIDTISPHNALYSKTALIDIRNYKLTSSDHLHFLTIKRVYGRIEDSSLFLKKVKYKQKDTAEGGYKNLIDLQVEKVESRGIDYRHLFQEQKIALRTLKFSNPTVDLFSIEDPVKRLSGKKLEDTTLLKNIAPYISESFLLDSFLVENGKVNYQIKNDQTNLLQSAENINLSFSHIDLDSLKYKQKVVVENISLKLNNYKFLKDGNTNLLIGSVNASVKDSTLKLKNVKFKYFQDDSVSIEALVIEGRGLDYLTLIKKKAANFGTVRIENPVFEITNKSRSKSKISAKKVVNDYGLLNNALIRTNKVFVTNAIVIHKIITSKGLIEQRALNLSAEVSKLIVDSTSLVSNHFYDRFFIKFNDYDIKVHNDNFRISIKDVSASSEQKAINFTNIFITQVTSFGPNQPYYFVDSIKTATASNVDFERFFIHQQVHATQVKMSNMVLKIFLDEGKESHNETSTSIPQDLFRKLPFYLRLDTIHINNSSLSYFVKNPKLQAKAEIYFDRLNLSAFNFTNDAKLMTRNTPANIRASAYMMGEGLLELNISVPFLSNSFDINYSGSIGAMKANVFNDLLLSTDLKVEKGKLLPGKFDVKISDGKAKGKLTFQYEDLHIIVLNQKDTKRSKLKSIIGNFIVKNGNPKKKGDDAETVDLTGFRTVDDSFFYFIWEVLRDGIVKTVTKDTLYEHIVKH